MVSLYGSVDEHPKMGFNVALNLRLPSGQIAAREVADTASSAIKNCFESLKEQLAKHMDHLRAAYKWPRRRRPAGRAESQVPFEETLASVQADVVSAQDINGWLNANLEKLQRFVERELRYRGNSGQMRVEQITAEEVISEAIANALDGRTEKPEKVTLEPWLYFLSRAAIDRLAEQARNAESEVGLDSSVRREEVTRQRRGDAPVPSSRRNAYQRERHCRRWRRDPGGDRRQRRSDGNDRGGPAATRITKTGRLSSCSRWKGSPCRKSPSLPSASRKRCGPRLRKPANNCGRRCRLPSN